MTTTRDQYEELRRAWKDYQAADPDNDKVQWDKFTGLCADYGIFVSNAVGELDPFLG